MFTLLDFVTENRILAMTISSIPMRQNRSILFFFNLKGGQGVIITYIFIEGVNGPTPLYEHVLLLARYWMGNSYMLSDLLTLTDLLTSPLSLTGPMNDCVTHTELSNTLALLIHTLKLFSHWGRSNILKYVSGLPSHA